MTLIQWDREHPTVGMTSWGEERRGERRQGGEQHIKGVKKLV